MSEQVDPQGWRDITSVPDDVEFIIAVWPVEDNESDVGEAWRDDSTSTWYSAFTNCPIEPTHWRPLPPPPETKNP